MTLGLAVLGIAAVLAFALILRDPGIPSGPERFIIAASWPLMIGTFALLQHAERDRLGLAAVVGSICVSTLGRPALIMDRVLTDEANNDPSLTPRKVAGIVALIVSGGAAAVWSAIGR